METLRRLAVVVVIVAGTAGIVAGVVWAVPRYQFTVLAESQLGVVRCDVRTGAVVLIGVRKDGTVGLRDLTELADKTP